MWIYSLIPNPNYTKVIVFFFQMGCCLTPHEMEHAMQTMKVDFDPIWST